MFATFNRFEIEMTLAHAKGAGQQGRCDDDVKALCQEPKIRRQLKKISDEDLKAGLQEYGAWGAEELQSREDNEQRIVWIAAGNIAEDAAGRQP